MIILYNVIVLFDSGKNDDSVLYTFEKRQITANYYSAMFLHSDRIGKTMHVVS